MSASTCFILNTASNKTKAEAVFKKRLERIKTEFPGAEIIFVKPEDSIAQIAEKAAVTHKFIIACGGDGTSNQVAKGLCGSKCVMGVLPFGSGNDFARNIGMSRDFEENLRILKNRNTRQIDVLEFDDQLCINTFGIGVDGLTNYFASQSNIRNGVFRYFWNGLKAMVLNKTFQADIKLDEDVKFRETVWMLTVANGKTEGGKYEISPTSDNSDGIIELIVVKPVHRLKLILEFIKLSFGKNFDLAIVDSYSFTKTLAIQTSTAVKAHYDGEQAPDKQEFIFHIKPKAVSVAVPE